MGSAIASAALDVIVDEGLIQKSAEMGAYLREKRRGMNSELVKEVRGKGLLITVELVDAAGKARQYTEAMMREGVLAKETHETVIRFAPPLVISQEEVDWAMERIKSVLVKNSGT